MGTVTFAAAMSDTGQTIEGCAKVTSKNTVVDSTGQVTFRASDEIRLGGDGGDFRVVLG